MVMYALLTLAALCLERVEKQSTQVRVISHLCSCDYGWRTPTSPA
jgi:hypothetical protein